MGGVCGKCRCKLRCCRRRKKRPSQVERGYLWFLLVPLGIFSCTNDRDEYHWRLQTENHCAHWFCVARRQTTLRQYCLPKRRVRTETVPTACSSNVSVDFWIQYVYSVPHSIKLIDSSEHRIVSEPVRILLHCGKGTYENEVLRFMLIL